MRALNFSVIPLLSCNIIASGFVHCLVIIAFSSVAARLNPASQGKIALLTFAYCVFMNITGSFLGLVTTSLINPGGRYGTIPLESTVVHTAETISLVDVFPDFLRNMVPDNILKTLLFSTVTTYVPTTSNATENNGTNTTNVIFHRDVGVKSGPNILGILVSSLVLGLIAGSRVEKTGPFIALAEAVTEVMTVLIEKTVKLLPVAMISLIASAVARINRLEQSLLALALFVASSAACMAILAFIVLPLFFLVCVRRNLFRVYAAISAPLLTAFSLTSSLIALPDLFKACDRLGVNPQVVRTIAPFLTSFNANGSAAFIAAAACCAAQFVGYSFNVGQLIAIGFLAGLNVMALPAVPSASLITVFLIVRVFSIPESAISLLFVVEFIVDRLRTTVNVLSHATCILFVHYRCAKTKLGIDEEFGPIGVRALSFAGDAPQYLGSQFPMNGLVKNGENVPTTATQGISDS
ncbi:Excitatory amino acid transporter 3 [Clonorchis sinensis]|uniref:Amino acid transporter n=1 Tax=Clonorchis sinensis TaxID=79923 RepID=A0A8T1MBP0_CLOSI|nr:Excitatory amino acid transporter 3 [Clonorchis sinensis]